MTSFLFGLSLIVFGLLVRCFCCNPCTIFRDNFSADNLDTNWNDVAGSWSVSAGKLVTTSANAVIVANATTDGDATAGIVSVDITCATLTDIGHLILAYNAGNYWHVAVQPGTISGTITIYENGVSRATAPLTSYNPGETVSVTLCIANGYVSAEAVVHTIAFPATPVIIAWAASPAMASTKAGCGTGATSADVKFANFALKRHRADNPKCDSCSVTCISSGCVNSTLAMLMQYEVEGVTDVPAPGFSICSACDEVNATYVLRFTGPDGSCGGNCCYRLVDPLPAPLSSCGYDDVYGFVVSAAPPATGSQYGLQIVGPPIGPNGRLLPFGGNDPAAACDSWVDKPGVGGSTFPSESFNCHAAGATILVTAL